MSSLFFNPHTLDLSYCSRDGISYPINQDLTLLNDYETTFRVNRFRMEVSLSCDLQCDYCIVFMNKIAKPTRLMSLETAKRIVDDFNQSIGSMGDIVIIGGEPLLNWNIVDYIIRNCAGRVLLFTNLLQIDSSRLGFLKEYGTRVLTSLDGFNEYQNGYRFHSLRMNELNRTIRNIKEAVSIGCNLGIACLVTDRNVSDLTAIADYFCDELGCRSFSFAYSHHLLNSTKVNEYDFQDYINAMCNLFDHAKEKGFYIDQIGRILRGILRKENCLVGCKAGTSQRTFYPDGSETICTKLDLINKTDIKEIATLFPYNNIHCQDCVAFNLCGGGCLWDSQMRPGPCLADPRLCESKQAFTNYVLQDIENELDQMPLAVFQKGKQLEYLEKKYVPML